MKDVSPILRVTITNPAMDTVLMVDQVVARAERLIQVQLRLVAPNATGLHHLDVRRDEVLVPLHLELKVPVERLNLDLGVMAGLAFATLAHHGSSRHFDDLVGVVRDLVGTLHVKVVHELSGTHLVLEVGPGIGEDQ